ncbi:helix-turn-helix domain-containing protein [uncultured Megamonas sp.]|uniref:helix-turn-helix domain-containing protein n=1 Tax=uncultured Megamonas sp. TaxID=286140 RepID=UPI002594C775|nr:helix-turn-helix domain-containing protein [uncultured Megamonas sp.]
MGVYVHKSVLELADLTNREKLVLAYFFNLKLKKINLSNKEIALTLNFSAIEIKKIVLSLKNKKYISLVGNTTKREIKIKKNLEMKFEKATFNGFNLDDDILKLDLNTTKKFVLAEIRSLISSKNGKCTASNLHIANLLKLKERAIQTALLELEKNGFLKRNLKNVNGKTERTIILNLNNTATDETAVNFNEIKEEVPEQQYNDEVLAIFKSFPKRPMMSDFKVEEQKSLCLPILKSKSKDELEFIKFVIGFNVKNNESWKAGFMPYMYKFLEVDKEKYFNEAVKLEFDKFRNKPKVNANLQLLNLQLERDLFDFFSEIEESVWEATDLEILKEFKIRYINGYLKFNDIDFNKRALKKIKEYRPSNLNF